MCCTAGWPIPIEPERAVLITNREWSAKGGVLPRTADGACVFHDGRCTVYQHRPMSCVHFPYVCLIDARGVHVTLSHYCPTAASLLFDHDGPIEIIEGPSPVPGREVPEGLDARESLPPLAEHSISKSQAPNPKSQTRSHKRQAATPRLMSFEEFSNWERDALRTLTSMAGDSEFAPVIERFLAAKLFASWAAYLGDGTTAVRHSVRAAHAVLQEEMARAVKQAARPIDAGLLKQAIRRTDLRLVHAVTSPEDRLPR